MDKAAAAENFSNKPEDLVHRHMDYARALTHKIARGLPPSVDFDELIGFANVGLTEAAVKFQPDLGVAFTTFAYYRIRGAVFDGLRKMTWLPPAARKKTTLQGAEDELMQTGIGEVDLNASAEDTANEFRNIVRNLGAVFLLSEASDDGGELDPTDESSAADEAEKRDLAAKVREALTCLTTEQADIVRLLYYEHQSMTDVAASLGVNKSTVSRAHKKAIEQLRDALST
ncbi:MAG: RNA polymerase sigma factor for flagellar operon FliA [Planctomycetota bacterium]|jgi:RNA polymerase sigma factor for flagellar operon FliA